MNSHLIYCHQFFASSEVFSGRKAYYFLRKPIRLLKENGDCIQIVSIAYSNIFVPEAMLYLDDFLQHF